MIALNMALNGASRDETASYLSENFELEDPEALLDDVYARAATGSARGGPGAGPDQPAGEAISTRCPSGSRT